MSDKGIVVTGRGSTSSAPDTVVVSLGVSIRAASAPEAIANAAAAATDLLAALHGAGVQERDVATSRYGIHQEYRHTDDGSIPDGYRVVNTVEATIRDVTSVGGVIDAAAAAAGDAIEVQGINFALSDDAEARAAARDAAWHDAVAAATQLAELAGRRLGAAVSMREQPTHATATPVAGVRRAMAADAATPVSGGELSTSVSLEVRFELH